MFITIHICVIRNGSGLVDHLSKRPQALFPIEEMLYHKACISCVHLSFAIFIIRKKYMIAKFSVLFFRFRTFLYFCRVFLLLFFFCILSSLIFANLLKIHGCENFGWPFANNRCTRKIHVLQYYIRLRMSRLYLCIKLHFFNVYRQQKPTWQLVFTQFPKNSSFMLHSKLI